MNTNLLNNIAFDIVKDKVIEDKVKEYVNEEEKKQSELEPINLKEEEEAVDDDIFNEPDSEEERIMQAEINKRKDLFDREIEKQKEKAARKYGDYKDISETEFLDTMLKNEAVVCHFYHNDFERCKIMDKHLKAISEVHHETLFTRINADKSPFFTTKLAVKVIFFNKLYL
jgi:hypothetical protein